MADEGVRAALASDGALRASTEGLDRADVRRILHALADHLADTYHEGTPGTKT